MITHLVRFRPRPDLDASQRSALADAFSVALRSIPSIRRAKIGTRVTHGRPYEQLMRIDYSYAAILEFDDLDGLKAYLHHPAHEQLGTRFFEMFEEALMYDFDVTDADQGAAQLLASR